MRVYRVPLLQGFGGGWLLLSSFLIADLVAVRTAYAAEGAAQAAGGFRLTVIHGAVSLKAQESPLTQIFHELARQADFEVVSKRGTEEKVTLTSDRLPLAAAIKRLAKNAAIVYAKDPKSRAPRIAKVFLLAEGQAKPARGKAGASTAASGTATEPAPPPEPFTFEFDLSQYQETE